MKSSPGTVAAGTVAVALASDTVDPAKILAELATQRFAQRAGVAAAAAPPRIVCLGVASIDLLAYVSSHPKPDDKLRTEKLLTRGGGNAANTATALARLGIPVSLVTKVGDDANGAAVVEELEKDGVDVQWIQRAGSRTGSSYIIVAAKEQSRTCIHTPASEELTAQEVKAMGEELWEGCMLLQLDTRHGDAAVFAAQQARARGIPILIDVEKDRPGVEELLMLADVVVTNSSFPREWTQPSSSTTQAHILYSFMRVLPFAKLIVSTHGEQGSVAVAAPRQGGLVEGMVRGLFDGLCLGQGLTGCQATGEYRDEQLPRCASEIRPNKESPEGFLVCHTEAYPMPAEGVVDTTGAGDAHIAGLCVGVFHRWSLRHMLSLAARVAWSKLRREGARDGLPQRGDWEVAPFFVAPPARQCVPPD